MEMHDGNYPNELSPVIEKNTVGKWSGESAPYIAINDRILTEALSKFCQARDPLPQRAASQVRANFFHTNLSLRAAPLGPAPQAEFLLSSPEQIAADILPAAVAARFLLHLA